MSLRVANTPASSSTSPRKRTRSIPNSLSLPTSVSSEDEYSAAVSTSSKTTSAAAQSSARSRGFNRIPPLPTVSSMSRTRSGSSKPAWCRHSRLSGGVRATRGMLAATRSRKHENCTAGGWAGGRFLFPTSCCTSTTSSPGSAAHRERRKRRRVHSANSGFEALLPSSPSSARCSCSVQTVGLGTTASNRASHFLRRCSSRRVGSFGVPFSTCVPCLFSSPKRAANASALCASCARQSSRCASSCRTCSRQRFSVFSPASSLSTRSSSSDAPGMYPRNAILRARLPTSSARAPVAVRTVCTTREHICVSMSSGKTAVFVFPVLEDSNAAPSSAHPLSSPSASAVA
mmetsp:Transcript_18429/g.46021  ORF Transcript_18429/g.46021 Transcript_18429/m.46021 type:complete len:345 (-) Transcript_18429:1066-2100(-)